MLCPHCGQATPGIAGRCSSCNGLLPADRQTQIAAGVLTPVLPSAPLPSEGDTDETKFVGDSSAPDSSRGSQHSSAVRQAGLSGTSGLFAPGYAFGGRYRIIRLIGAGGMGAVYQAWDEELSVAVAIKIIRP